MSFIQSQLVTFEHLAEYTATIKAKKLYLCLVVQHVLLRAEAVLYKLRQSLHYYSLPAFCHSQWNVLERIKA